MIYVDELYYAKNYLLGRKPVISAGFPFYAMQASKIVDKCTFDRLKCEGNINEDVRMCCCELAEHIYKSEQRKEAAFGKTSEKVGSYSVSFASSSELEKEMHTEQLGIVRKWLERTGLLYAGV